MKHKTNDYIGDRFMDDLIENFKKQNGNVTYTTKELIQALHEKIDTKFTELEAKLDTKADTCVVDKNRSMIMTVIGACCTVGLLLIGGAYYWIQLLHYK